MSAVLNDQDWQVRAACRGPQIKIFFPPSHFERKSDKRGFHRVGAKESGVFGTQKVETVYKSNIPS